MSDATLHFFQRMADAFLNCELETVAEKFVYPLPYYAQGDALVFGAKHSLIEAMNLYHQAVLVAGIVRIKPRIVAQGLPSRGYTNMWVEFDHFDAGGSCISTNQARYLIFQSDPSKEPRVEMVDFTVASYPDLALLSNTVQIERAAQF